MTSPNLTSFRFYPAELPSRDDVVMVRTVSVTSLGVYVVLQEYAEAEGMISTSELAKKRIRSLAQVVKVDQAFPCLVLRVDQRTKCIDLSKSRVTPEEGQACRARYSRGKTAHSIIGRTCEKLELTNRDQMEELFSRTLWYVTSGTKKRRNPFKVFLESLHHPDILQQQYPLEDRTSQELLATIKSRLSENKMNLVAYVSVRCFGPDGVDGVKDALRTGCDPSTPHLSVKVRYMDSPRYSITLETTQRYKTAAVSAIEKTIDNIKHRILKFEGGSFALLQQPTRFRSRSDDGRDNNSDDDEDDDDDTIDEEEDLDYYSDTSNEQSDAGCNDGVIADGKCQGCQSTENLVSGDDSGLGQ